MTTLPPFQLSITSGPTPPDLDKPLVLDLFGNATESGCGGFNYDMASGDFNHIWNSLANFEGWHQEQCQTNSIELLLSGSWTGTHFVWKRVYRCTCQGTGGEKPYKRKYLKQDQKIGSKRSGCTCQLVVKAYPGIDTILGAYTDDHDHPIDIQNLIYTRISENEKGKVRYLLEQGIQPRRVVCNHRFLVMSSANSVTASIYLWNGN